MTTEEKVTKLAEKMLRLELLKAQFEADNKALIDEIASDSAEIKAEVLERGETVKTPAMHAIWNKGKTTWDSRLLDGYAVAHPEILQARKVGNPTVSFRLAK